MTDTVTVTSRVLPGHAGTAALHTDGIRFMIDSAETGGRFAMVELRLGPRTLAAPVHRHSREDEFGYVTRGRITALLGDEVVTAGPGDLIVLREESAAGEALGDPATIVELAARYGCEVDLDATAELVARHGLDGW